MNKEYYTIFDYSQKELSQDAFLAWLFMFADEEVRKTYANRFPWKEKNIISQIGELSIEILRLFTGIKNLQPRTIEIEKQWENTDLWVEIDGIYSLIIEDKTGTSEHDDQLTIYRDKAGKWCSENNRKLFCVYYKTETFTSDEKKDVENKGYSVFTRKDILNIFDKNKELLHFDDILASYYEFIKNKEKLEHSFLTMKLDDWEWNQYVGFFHELDAEFNEKHKSNWGYVNNYNGGFCGFWWHFKYIDEDYYVYLQFEDNTLVIKVGEIYENQSEIRNALVKKMNEIASEFSISIQKPLRYGCGKTMTLGIVDRKEWFVKTAEGYIDFEKTKHNLENLTLFIDKF